MYLGLEGEHPRLRFDLQLDAHGYQAETVVGHHWHTTRPPERLPNLLEHGLRATLEVLGANLAAVRLRVASPLRVTYEGG